MPVMPDLIGKRAFEFANLAVGQEHIVSWETLPAGASLKYQSYDYVLQSLEDAAAHECMIYDLSCWWLPCYGSDAAETVDNLADLKNLYDMYVPKVDSTAPDTDWSVTEDDASIGDDDNELYFRPDRVSLMTLTQPAKPAKLYGKRGWLGWAEGSAYRTGSGSSVRYMTRSKGFVRRGVNTSYPGYIVWVLTIPPQFEVRDFGTGAGTDSVAPDEDISAAHTSAMVANTFPANQEFAELDFLAPMWDPIQASRSVANSGLDQWRRWAIQFVAGPVDASEAGEARQTYQRPLHIRFRRQICMSREIKGLDTVSPDA